MTPGTLSPFRPALAITHRVVLHKQAWVFSYYVCCKEATLYEKRKHWRWESPSLKLIFSLSEPEN